MILKTIFKLRNAQKKSKNLLQWWFTDPRFYKSPCFKNLAIFLQMIKTKWCISFFRQTKIFTPCSYTNVWDCFFKFCTAWKVSKCGVFSGPYFRIFWLNTEIYSVNLRIQSEYRKIRTRNNPVLGHFSFIYLLTLF